MRYTLLESGARSERRMAGTMVSVLLHGGVIALAVAGTARATTRLSPEPATTRVVYAAPRPAPKPAGPRPVVDRIPPDVSRMATSIQPPRTIPIDISTQRLGIDLSRALDRSHLFDGAPTTVSATGAGTDADARGEPADGVWTEARVDRAVVGRPGNPTPRYPEALRAARVEGVVVARFVVDSTGRVEPASIAFLEATHARFADAVRVALLASRYEPAEVGGRRVRQLVEQRFAFRLAP